MATKADLKKNISIKIKELSKDYKSNKQTIDALTEVLVNVEDNKYAFAEIRKSYKHDWTFDNLDENALKRVRQKYSNQISTHLATISNKETFCRNVMLHCFAEVWFQTKYAVHSLAKSNITIRCLASYKLELDSDFKVVGHKDEGDDTLIDYPRKLDKNLVIVTYNDTLKEFNFACAIFSFDYNKAAKFSMIDRYDRDIIIHENFLHRQDFKENPVFVNTTNSYLSDKANTCLNRMQKQFKHENIQETFDHIITVLKNKITNDNFKKRMLYTNPIGIKSKFAINTPKDIATLLNTYELRCINTMILAAFKNIQEF